MPFGVLTAAHRLASPWSLGPAKPAALKADVPLMASVTLAPEKQNSNCLSLNKLSFNMQKAGFIGLNGPTENKRKGMGCIEKAPLARRAGM